MTRVANISIKESYVLSDNPLLLTMIYRMPNAPIKLRIEAIEKSKKLLVHQNAFKAIKFGQQ